ncbi:hypothetical protein AB0F68_07245 [Micromonospora sp. NPDC023966]|uniref:hypothetical protein n=1 Tax=Micromonospora sp. NPDC023966 TaxID=3154699 RepID=UPI0033D15F2B
MKITLEIVRKPAGGRCRTAGWWWPPPPGWTPASADLGGCHEVRSTPSLLKLASILATLNATEHRAALDDFARQVTVAGEPVSRSSRCLQPSTALQPARAAAGRFVIDGLKEAEDWALGQQGVRLRKHRAERDCSAQRWNRLGGGFTRPCP